MLLYCISKMNINAAFVFKYLLNTYSGVFKEKHTNISNLYLLQIKFSH